MTETKSIESEIARRLAKSVVAPPFFPMVVVRVCTGDALSITDDVVPGATARAEIHDVGPGGTRVDAELLGDVSTQVDPAEMRQIGASVLHIVAAGDSVHVTALGSDDLGPIALLLSVGYGRGATFTEALANLFARKA